MKLNFLIVLIISALLGAVMAIPGQPPSGPPPNGPRPSGPPPDGRRGPPPTNSTSSG
ncbi:basic salivary proline-rich protein 2 [Zeugodacus cucurbitae]|uniref:basic salivary proline-rich protein 2 n=1 Tax=Zeugodacus cucurbitae TaxID=28588 RepID=UPI0023D948FA|nr:basic salivary proline-rich protein 2 [Zeugodacus cucurbitae]